MQSAKDEDYFTLFLPHITTQPLQLQPTTCTRVII